MNRRTVLRTLGLGVASTTTGCLGRVGPLGGGPTVTAVDTGFPWLEGPYYGVDVDPIDGPGEEPVSFEALEPAARVELANAVHRDRYWTNTSRLVLTDRNRDVLSYRGRSFEPRIVVVDMWSTEHGPENDPDWTDPVELVADTVGGELAVEIVNRLEDDLRVHHHGRPYFGVLVAVGGPSVVLEHDCYEDNDLVRTSGLVTTGNPREGEARTEVLPTGESLRESYPLREDLPPESTIWLSIRIGDDSIGAFRNQPTVLVGTIELEA